MTTTAAITATSPLAVTIVTDQHMLEIAGTLTVTSGADVTPVPYDVKSIKNPVQLADSTGHLWTVVSDDKAVPTSTIVVRY